MRGAEAPSALTHGLTSRWAMEALAEDVEALAPELIGASPATEAITKAARKAAEAILHMQQVRVTKTLALNQARAQVREAPGQKAPQPPKGSHSGLFPPEFNDLRDLLGSGRWRAEAEHPSLDPEADAILKFMDEYGQLLQRLDDYERRALSQRTKAIRELDFARIEAERLRAVGPGAEQMN